MISNEGLKFGTCIPAQVLTPTADAWEQRKQCVSRHVQRLATQLNMPRQITISPFGSSLSGLCEFSTWPM
jgi:hypothetical protein